MSRGGVGILEADVTLESFVFRFVRCGLVKADTFDTVARHSDVVAFASQFKGVYRKGNRWRAQITYNGKKHQVGAFDTQEEYALLMSLEVRYWW